MSSLRSPYPLVFAPGPRFSSESWISWCTMWVGGKGSLLRIRAESMHLMAQPGIALLLQATVGHWVTVGFNTPPGPRTPGTEPGTEPCREDTGLRGSGTLLRGPGCCWGGWGADGGGCCCCCSFFLLIFLSFARRF